MTTSVRGHRYVTLPVDAEWVDTSDLLLEGSVTFGGRDGVVTIDLASGGVVGMVRDPGAATPEDGDSESERGVVLPGVPGRVCASAVEGALVAAVVEVGDEHQLVTGRLDGVLARVAYATHESVGARAEGIAAMATGRPPALHLVRAYDGTATRVTVALPNLGDSRVHALFFHDGHAWVLIGRTLVAIDLAALPSHVVNASVAAEYRPFDPEGPGPLEAPAIDVVTLL
jgi:hypothetical protein